MRGFTLLLTLIVVNATLEKKNFIKLALPTTRMICIPAPNMPSIIYTTVSKMSRTTKNVWIKY